MLSRPGEADKTARYLVGERQERFWKDNGYLPVGQTLFAAADIGKNTSSLCRKDA